MGEARPDFYYAAHAACVYVDGPVHRYPERAARDAPIRARLAEDGYQVVVIDDDPSGWAAALARYPDIFGSGQDE